MKKLISSKPILSFFIFSVLWSWIFFGTLIILKITGRNLIEEYNERSILFYLLYLFGALGPGVAGLIFTKITEGGLIHLFSRLKFSAFNKYLYFVFLIPFVCVLFTRLFFSLFDISPLVDWNNWLMVLIFSLLSGIFQEFGWRGFAHRKFLDRTSPLIAGIAVGFMWGTWSLASLYWTANNFFGKLFGVYFVASAFIPLLSYSVIISWMYNLTKGNLLFIILFHTSIFFFQNVFIVSGKNAIESVKLFLIYSMATFVLAAIISLSVKTMWSKKIESAQ